MRKLLIVTLMVVVCIAFAGCGGDAAVLNPDADKEGVTDDSWSKDVWDSAVQDMFDKGYAEKDPDEGVIFKCQANGELFLSEEGKAALTADDFRLEEGKVIWGSEYATQSETEAPRVDPCVRPKEGQEEELPHYVSENAVAPTKPEAFADTRGQCKYLILMTALCFNVAHDYYVGPLDRLDIVTYVFVIDAVNKEVVHIHYINYSVPGAVAHSYMGEIYEETAYHYMNSLCQ